MNGLLVPPPAYTQAGVQPPEAKPPTPPPDSAPPVAVAVTVQTPPTPQPTRASAPASAPAFVVDFSGVSGSYVLDWRDPKTHSVLVQVPMRTALAQIPGAATPEHVGTLVNTTA